MQIAFGLKIYKKEEKENLVELGNENGTRERGGDREKA